MWRVYDKYYSIQECKNDIISFEKNLCYYYILITFAI